VGLLLSLRDGMTWFDVAWQIVLATLGIAALAAACQGWLLRELRGWERALLTLAGILMVFPASLEALAPGLVPHPHLIGVALAVLLMGLQWRLRPA
jgi:TRAP-type uncharacterized transport system fused permease subunit